MKQLTIIIYSLVALSLVWMASLHAGEHSNKKKVLMVVSGYGQKTAPEQPGYEFDEFAKAYQVFKANGIAVDVASPKGGKVEADQFDAKKPYNAPVLADEKIMAKLDNTLATSALDAKQYQGIFIVGGKGAMFDLPKDTALQQLVADIYQQHGSVAAVCHGPAALVNVKLTNGQYLVADKAVNAFTNQEEKLFGKKWLAQFEFLLEDKLVERGAKFQSSDIMLSHVAVDGRLITGQNPSSTTDVANALVASLGLTPVTVEPYLEDKTMAQIARVLTGDSNAIAELKQNPKQYHIALVGMYGFYYLKVAESEQDLQNALSLMQLAQSTINNPKLDITIAKTQHKLGKTAQAKQTLKQLLVTKPDYQPALELQASIAK